MTCHPHLQVEILSEGDSINELMILVGGMVEMLKPGVEGSEELMIDIDGHNSIRGGYARCYSAIPEPESYLGALPGISQVAHTALGPKSSSPIPHNLETIEEAWRAGRCLEVGTPSGRSPSSRR